MADSQYEIVHAHYADATAALAAMNDQNWAYEEALQRIIVMDGATPRYFYDSEFLEGNFAQLQDAIDQPGSIRLDGNGTFTGNGSFEGTLTTQMNFTAYYFGAFGLTHEWSIAGGIDMGIVMTVASLTKNDANADERSMFWARPTINTGGSNSGQTLNLFYGDTTNTAVTGVTTNLIKLLYGGSQKFNVDSNGIITIAESANAPANPTSGTEARIYVKANLLIIQFNDGGTTRYKYLDLTGTGVTWVHTTSAP